MIFVLVSIKEMAPTRGFKLREGSFPALQSSLHATRNHFHSNELIFWLSSQTIIDKLLLTGLVCELSRQNMDFYNLLITTREIYLQCTSFYPNYAGTWDTNNTPPRPAPYTAPAPAPVNRIISPGAGRCRAGAGRICKYRHICQHNNGKGPDTIGMETAFCSAANWKYYSGDKHVIAENLYLLATLKCLSVSMIW